MEVYVKSASFTTTLSLHIHWHPKESICFPADVVFLLWRDEDTVTIDMLVDLLVAQRKLMIDQHTQIDLQNHISS